MRPSKILVFSLLASIFAFSCKQAPIEVSSVSLNTATVEMVEGDTYSLVATVLPSNAEYEGINWASSNTSVASVNQGTVTALKEGKTTITASAGGKSATCSVTVSAKYIAVTSITLDKSELSLKVGSADVLIATVKPDDATDKSVKWSSSDASIVKVDNGKVTALKSGTATITTTAGSCSAECVITTFVETESITLDKSEVTLNEGETATLAATIAPADATDQNITWTSSNTDVATVDNGTVKALKAGTATITAECGGKKAECVVTVLVPTDSVTLDKTSLELSVGESFTLIATVKPDNAADKNVTWSSSDSEIATVKDGIVTAHKIGTATITAAAGGKTAVCTVTVCGNIVFKDNIVKEACVAKFDTNGDGEISYKEASAVTDLTGLFDNYSKITSFDELIYFDNVSELPNRLFKMCSQLKTVSIPSSVSKLGYGCFYRCSSLTSVNVPSSVTILGERCFYHCISLTSIEIPSSVTELGTGCFLYCKALTDIVIPSSITKLPNECFLLCSSLYSIKIPSSVTELCNDCFGECSSLTDINIPSSVTTLGDSCFIGCSSLTSINIPSSVTSLGRGCFSGCSSLTSINIPSSVTSLGDDCFARCSSLTSIDIPSSVTKIGNSCFESCTSLVSINIPSSVTTLGEHCFWKCKSLTNVNIPSSVIQLGYGSFYGCESLSSIDIPSSVTELPSDCFACCYSLSNVNIPSSVTELGESCFSACTNLSTIRCRAKAVPNVGYCAFYRTKADSGYLYVPEESIELYKNADGWKSWKFIQKL